MQFVETRSFGAWVAEPLIAQLRLTTERLLLAKNLSTPLLNLLTTYCNLLHIASSCHLLALTSTCCHLLPLKCVPLWVTKP